MNTLQKLLDPYRSAVAGDPTRMGDLKQDPIYSSLPQFSLSDVVRNATNSQNEGANPTHASGLLELIFGGNKRNVHSADPSHQTHLHVAMQNGIVGLGKYLQDLGFDIGEHPKFGGVDPVHSENSYHYANKALDVNYSGNGRWGSEDKALNWLEKYLLRNY